MKKTVSLAIIVTLSFCVTIMAHGDATSIQKRRITLDDLSREDLNQFLDDILNKREKAGEEDKTSCNSSFEEEDGIILRTRDSIRGGAEFIEAPEEVDTTAECKEACCGAVSKKTSRHCDLAVFQKSNVKDTKSRCYLFSCSDETGKDVCVTSPNDDYKILRIKKERVEDQLLDIITNSSTIKKANGTGKKVTGKKVTGKKETGKNETGKKETEKNEEKDERGKCLKQFTNQSRRIIRTSDSIANGAVFLKATPAVDTQEECQTQCCSTIDKSSRHCDLAIFQTNRDDADNLQPRCFLFSCTDENGQFQCVTSPNDDYVVLKRIVDVEEDQLFDVATSLSTSTTTPTTSIIPSTTTPSVRTKTSEQTSAHSKTCKRLEWKCDNGACIEVTQVCNGKSDCSDNSDESSCEIFLESSKPKSNPEDKNIEFNLKPETKRLKSLTQSSTTTKNPTTPTSIKTTSPTNPPVVTMKDDSGIQNPEAEKNSQLVSNSLSKAKKDDFISEKTEPTLIKTTSPTTSPEVEKNSQSMLNSLSKDDFIIERTEPQKGAVLPLALGFSVTSCVLLMVGCRLHIMKKKLRRRGKPLSMEESDYLINGMYL